MSTISQQTRNIRLIAFLSVLFICTWWLNPNIVVNNTTQYSTLHTAMETLAICVAMQVFGITWNARLSQQSINIVFLGCTFLAVALLDFAHMLSIKGMPDFVTPGGVEKGINFWLAARIVAAIGLLGMALQPQLHPISSRTRYVFLGSALLITVVVYWIGLFHQAILPRTFIDGQGLTAFKISVEWGIVSLLAISALLFYHQIKQGVTHDATNLFAAVAISILSELYFMLYKDFGDIFNVLGHCYKVIAYLFIYQAMFVETVRLPYQRLSEIQNTLTHKQEILAQQSALLALFYELPFMGMAISSPDSKRWVAFNDCLCELLGYARSELTEKTWAELTHPDDLQADIEQFQRLLAGDINNYMMEKRFLHKNGSAVFTLVNIQCVRQSDGLVKHVIATVQDISDRKRAEDALKHLNLQLEHRIADRTAELVSLNQSLESFVYSVSHDLKTPLRGVEGYSRLLEEDFSAQLTGEGALFISNIREGIKRMNELIDDLLAYSRMERKKLNSSPVSLNGLLNTVIKEINLESAGYENHIQIRLPALTVYADADGLAMVLRNLLENAKKFSRLSQNRTIEIDAKQEHGHVVLWIKDNGIGFDMKYHDRIFEIFQRLNRIEDYPGTGIGLALVKKAMERMGGNVWAESVVNQGTTFYLQLPSSAQNLM